MLCMKDTETIVLMLLKMTNLISYKMKGKVMTPNNIEMCVKETRNSIKCAIVEMFDTHMVVALPWVANKSNLYGVLEENKQKYCVGDVPKFADVENMVRTAYKIAEKYGLKLDVNTCWKTYPNSEDLLERRILQLKEEWNENKFCLDNGYWVRGSLGVVFYS